MNDITRVRAMLGMPFPEELERRPTTPEIERIREDCEFMADLPSVTVIDQRRRAELARRILDGLTAARELAADYERAGYCTFASSLRGALSSCAALEERAKIALEIR